MLPTRENLTSHPSALRMDRLWRWCVLKTLRDLHVSARRGRALSMPNVERLFLLRWNRSAGEAKGTARSKGRTLGTTFIRQYYQQRQPFCFARESGLTPEPANVDLPIPRC